MGLRIFKVTRLIIHKSSSSDPTQHPIRCQNSSILRLLKNGNATHIRIGELQPAATFSRLQARSIPHEPWHRTHHCMTIAKHVDARNTLPNAGMRPFQIIQNVFFPGAPIGAMLTVDSLHRQTLLVADLPGTTSPLPVWAVSL